MVHFSRDLLAFVSVTQYCRGTRHFERGTRQRSSSVPFSPQQSSPTLAHRKWRFRGSKKLKKKKVDHAKRQTVTDRRYCCGEGGPPSIIAVLTFSATSLLEVKDLECEGEKGKTLKGRPQGGCAGRGGTKRKEGGEKSIALLFYIPSFWQTPPTRHFHRFW